MTHENNETQIDLRKHAARLRELNDTLRMLGSDFVGTIPEDLEHLEELLEKKFGPELWKRLDRISKEPEGKETEESLCSND